MSSSHVFRPCGECTACCTALGVHELDKPEFVKCKHECGTHCGIYEDRPASCRQYQCLWTAMSEEVGVEFRPDNLGVIVEIADTKVGKAVVAREVIPGCLDDKQGIAARFVMGIAQHIRGFIVVFREGRKRQSFFPPWAKEARRESKIIVEGYREGDRQVLHKPAIRKQENKKKRRKEMAKKSKRRNRC